MINRAKETLYLTPAIILLFVWIAAAPRLVEQVSTLYLIMLAVLSSLVAAWCIASFAHAMFSRKE